MVRSWLSHAETALPAILALAQLPTSRRLAQRGFKLSLKCLMLFKLQVAT